MSPAVVLHAIQNANNFDKGALEGALVYAKEKEEEQKEEEEEGDQQKSRRRKKRRWNSSSIKRR